MSGTPSAEPRPARAWERLSGRLGVGSLRGRIVLATTASVLVGMLVALLALGSVLGHSTARAVDEELSARVAAVRAGLQADADSPTGLRVPTGLLLEGDAVLTPAGRVVAGTVDPRALRVVPTLLGEVPPPGRGLAYAGLDDRVRVAAAGARVDGRTVVVVASEPLAGYERVRHLALLGGLVLALVVVAASGLVAAWATSRALEPVEAMAAAAEDWSRRSLDRRFEDPAVRGSATEIRRLADTLDGLLDRVATTIRAEQRLSAELAHELRTPLAGVQGTVDVLLLRGDLPEDLREDFDEVAASTRRMAETISMLLALARTGSAEAGGRTDSRLGPALAESADDLPVEGPRAWSDAVVGAPTSVVAAVLAPLVDNARRHARSRSWIEVVLSPERVRVRVCDDGDGIDPDVAEQVFEPGTSYAGGTGLGLAVARRLARSVGGDVTAAPAGEPGGRVEVTLPRSRWSADRSARQG